MRSSINYLGPSIALTLLLGEICISWLSLFHPRVDKLFADYYIVGSRPCWMSTSMVQQAATSLRTDHIKLSQLDQIDACYVLEAGWSEIESWGVWSNARNVKIELPVVAGTSLITLTMIGASPQNRQSIRVSINNSLVGTFFVPNNKRSLVLLPVPYDPQNQLEISIRIKHLVRASERDSRELGIGLIAIDAK